MVDMPCLFTAKQLDFKPFSGFFVFFFLSSILNVYHFLTVEAKNAWQNWQQSLLILKLSLWTNEPKLCLPCGKSDGLLPAWEIRTFDGFTSAEKFSDNFMYCNPDADIQIFIKPKTGKDIFSFHPGENEVLSLSESKFIVKEIEPWRNKYFILLEEKIVKKTPEQIEHAIVFLYELVDRGEKDKKFADKQAKKIRNQEPYSDPRWYQPLGVKRTGERIEFTEEEKKKRKKNCIAL